MESEADNGQNIMVRVIFLQPIVKGMLFCPFYQKSTCRYEDKECNFSHGEVVPFMNLRDYRQVLYLKAFFRL